MRFRFLFKFSRLGILIYRGMTLILPRFGPTRRQESGTSWSTWPPSVAKRLLSRPWARCWSVKGIVISLDTNLFRISTIGFEQTFMASLNINNKKVIGWKSLILKHPDIFFYFHFVKIAIQMFLEDHICCLSMLLFETLEQMNISSALYIQQKQFKFSY